MKKVIVFTFFLLSLNILLANSNINNKNKTNVHTFSTFKASEKDNLVKKNISDEDNEDEDDENEKEVDIPKCLKQFGINPKKEKFKVSNGMIILKNKIRIPITECNQ